MPIINFLKRYKLLILILLVASILRLWNLESFPPHLRNDEAALGYNAYSILNTGRDEHGEFLPLIFKSFGDWKMGLYVYLTIPFIVVFGLSEWSVKLPSAISGILAVWLIYLVTMGLFKKKSTAVLSAFLLSVSPIFVPFSRGAWEVNLTFSLTLAGIYFFLRALKTHAFLVVSAIFFGLTLISSHGAKFSTPVIMGLLVITFFKDFRRINFKHVYSAGFIILLFLIPVIFSFAQGKVSRLTTLSIFSYPSGSGLDLVDYFAKGILSRWMSLYSLKTLVIKGDLNPQHGAPDTGPFLLIDAIFLLFGFIKVMRTGFTKQMLLILSTLFLLGLPSALTIEKANFERVPTLFIPLLLIEAFGVVVFWEKFRKKRWFFGLLAALYIGNYFYFLDQYFVHGPKKNDAWQYGYKQIVEKVTPLQTKYRQIVMQQSLEQPYIFFLFYQKYDPQKYQQIAANAFTPNKEGKDMGMVSSIGNIKFADINWKEKVESKTLYVMPKYLLDKESEVYSSYKAVDTVYDLNGFPLFKIVETYER